MSEPDAPERQVVPVTPDESLAVTHHPASGDRWVVFCHGFLSDRNGSYGSRCRRAVEAGYDAVRFDFRGCGESDGTFVEQTLTDKLADLAAVVDYFGLDSYALFGSSFGGKVAFHAAADDPGVEAVAARAPVTYNRAFQGYRRVVEREGVCEFEDGRRIDDRFFEDFDRYPFSEVALDVPVAIFHGASDGSVDIDDSFEAARRLETDVLVEKFADEGHRFSPGGERRLRVRLFNWLSATLPEE